MHAILVTVGTDGDIFPYAALGSTLHRCGGIGMTLVTNEQSRGPGGASRPRLPRLALRGRGQGAARRPPTSGTPLKGGAIAAQWVTPVHPAAINALLDELSGDHGCRARRQPGSRLRPARSGDAGEALEQVVLQPGLIPSVSLPPVMPGFTLPRRASVGAGKLVLALVDLAGGWVVGGNTSIGSGPRSAWRRSGASSSEVVFAGASSSGCSRAISARHSATGHHRSKLTGFPLYDGQPDGGLPPDLLRFCLEGDPPVVFTFGTGMMHAADTFRKAVEVCRLLGKAAESC